MASTDDIPAYFGDGADTNFLNLADVALVIGGRDSDGRRELLAHSQLLSRQCKASSDVK